MLPALVVCPVQLGGAECLNPFSDEGGGGCLGGSLESMCMGVQCVDATFPFSQ